MPKFGTAVKFHAGDGKRLAFVIGPGDEEGMVNLQSFDPQTGAGSVDKNVPEGEGGHTYETIK